MEIELHASATVSVELNTVGDLIEFARILDTRQVDFESELDWGGAARVFVDLKVHEVDWIECGDHRPYMRPDGEWSSWSDVIIVTHGHDSEIPGQMSTDDITKVEPQMLHQPSDYDWPAFDRAKRTRQSEGAQ